MVMGDGDAMVVFGLDMRQASTLLEDKRRLREPRRDLEDALSADLGRSEFVPCSCCSIFFLECCFMFSCTI